MGAFADRAVKNASRQINDKGNDITLVHRYNCSYDPVTGEDTCTEDSYATKGVFSNFILSDIDGVNVMSDDILVTVAWGVNIDQTWQLIYDSVTYEFIASTVVTTQNTLIIQKLQVRALG